MGWLNIVPLAICGIFIALGLTYLIDGLDGLRAEATGIRGMVTITDCRPHLGRNDIQVGWDCAGSFASADGTVRIGRVAFTDYFEERPAQPVPAKVATSTSDKAHATDGFWSVQLGLGIAGVFAAPAATAWWWYSPKRNSRKRAPERGGAG